MLPLGSVLPDFDLPLVKVDDPKDNSIDDSSDRMNIHMLNSKPVLVMVLCAHCPFVKHVEHQITQLNDDFGDTIQLVGIASNCLETHPQDGPEYLAKQITENRWTFPYLLDLEQAFAKSLKAACTPDFFLFATSLNGEHRLIYRGQLDSSRPGNNIPSTGSDIRSALDAILNSRKVSIVQKPSIGCNIKWKPGLEPPWFQ